MLESTRRLEWNWHQVREKKTQESAPRVAWNQYQAIEGKTPTITFITQANCKTIPNPVL